MFRIFDKIGQVKQEKKDYQNAKKINNKQWIL